MVGLLPLEQCILVRIQVWQLDIFILCSIFSLDRKGDQSWLKRRKSNFAKAGLWGVLLSIATTSKSTQIVSTHLRRSGLNAPIISPMRRCSVSMTPIRPTTTVSENSRLARSAGRDFFFYNRSDIVPNGQPDFKPYKSIGF